MRLTVLIAGLALYAAALFAPAIIFKPDVRSNLKRSECAFAVTDDVMCESFAFGGSGMTSCQRGQTPGKTFVDRAQILDYCKGWNQPVAGVLHGYEILAMGVLGVFLGMFAWFANLLILAAFVLSAFGRRLPAMILSMAAVALGLQSYALDAVPFNESSMAADDLNIVDRLGLGFYLWMGSLVAFTGYFLLKARKSAAGAFSVPAEEPPRAP